MSEEKRLAALDATKLLDSEIDERFERITRLAANALGSDMALISLLDGSRQWFKSKVGLQAKETPREQAFCSHAIQNPDDVMVVLDASADSRFAGNPLVTGDPNISFYAGVPLVTKEGYALGTLCVLDRTSRDGFSKQDIQVLRDLGASVMTEIELENQEVINSDLTIINTELQHRMGNMYAHISALITMIARTDMDKDQLVRRIRQKIKNLSQTQALLAAKHYKSVSLKELVASALSPFGSEVAAGRINIQKFDDFEVSPRGAFIMTLMLNELGTNAIKHGALSRPGGQIDVTWTNGDEVLFNWREYGVEGNDVTESREGFGTQILSKIVPMDLQGTANYNLTAHGLLYSVTAKPERLRFIATDSISDT
ncbi:GAF domain-containing protein [Hellea sp.]|nr:GAF domain-containing protein [Hellea sp.]